MSFTCPDVTNVNNKISIDTVIIMFRYLQLFLKKISTEILTQNVYKKVLIER